MADFTKTYDIVDSPGSQTAKQAILYNEANLDDLISDTNTKIGDITGTVDEDDMASDSAVKLCVQQSIKAYVDSGTVTMTNKTLTSPVINVTSDADGDTYYRASGVFARLAKGTANFKMFMNAAATAPEWAAGVKIVTTTRDITTATGTQAVTGVGFKPSHVIFIANVSATPKASVGFDDGTLHYNMRNYHGVTASTWASASTASIALQEAAGDYYEGYISVLGADGFTISWTKGGTPTGTANIYAFCFR